MNVSDAKDKSLGAQWLIHLMAVVALVISLVLWPQPARADWRSLTSLLPTYVGGVDFKISPDSHTVVFIADIDTDDVKELYAVPITGTTPIKLNPPLVEGGFVNQFIFMPDGQSVIYQAEQEVDNRFELFRVPVNGGPAVKLNGPLVAGGNVFAFNIDTGNGRVVYIADQETNEIFEVWSASLEGGGVGNVKLNDTLVTGGNVASFQIDPLSDRVVYNADQDTNGKYELYSVPIAGGSPLKLNPPLGAAGSDSGLFSFYAVNPVIPVVVFVAPESVAQGRRLYMIPTAGGELTQLNFNFPADQYLINFRISPTGDRVVFNVGTRLGNQYPSKGKLYSNLIGAGGAADVSEAGDPMFGVDRFEIMPDGNHIIYTFQEDADTPVRLESATMLGERVPLYSPTEQEGGISFNFSPDSDWVIFRQQVGGQDRLFTIPPTGGNSTSFGNVSYKQIFPDNSRITYSKKVGVDGQNELFSQQIFGGGERNLSGMNGEGYIANVDISPDSKWVIFVVQLPDQSGEQTQYQLRVSDGTSAQANTPTPTSTLTPTITPTPTVTHTPTVTPTGTVSLTPDPSETPPAGTTPGAFHAHLPTVFGQEPED